MNKEHQLEQLLRSRILEAEQPDFSERIIAASLQRTQVKQLSFIVWLNRLCAEFFLPKPVYTAIALLCIGLITGVGTSDAPEAGATKVTMMEELMDEEGTL